MITYEYPLNERIRTLLRLEDLFDKCAHFLAGEGPEEHHVALVTLFEILEAAGRADLKFDLMQELERQRQILLSFRNNPDISEDALSGALYEIEQASASLLSMQGRIGHYLRENEWLMAIKNRAAIPGGVCEFDLPSYHFWLHREAAARQADLRGWIGPMLAIRQALGIVLRLLRSSGRPEQQMAVRGAYQMMLAGRTAQMVRLRLTMDEAFVPEISASKYALNIRFLAPDVDHRPKQADASVNFELTFCNL
ncbi:cell division protein ZapD [Denitratisoma oestradiolicum]|uniref:Cell division protein ZapD n=1 Tax=Denitratisoma oestradiolicum TaxID=311182 RepID=A0A6S6YEQ3_9PROT|nr:cell division protein ZapD [Denitratisoma oestradiolicum]TWO80654.1 cell division protein ZapD [Denitratisoma oestradiolicum]CAB1371058.1 Cell division protein ZapD [Denitratisoma oestradiolicum]